MYDIIIIGNDLSSLVAAVISVFYGKATVLLSSHGLPATYTIANYNFNTNPLPLTGLGTNQIFSDFLSELGIFHEYEKNIVLLRPSLQFFFPNQRIELYNNNEELLMELQRELSVDEQELKNFCMNLSSLSNSSDILIKSSLRLHTKYRNRFISSLQSFSELLKLCWLLFRIILKIRNHKVLENIYKAKLQLLLNFSKEKVSFFSSLFSYILSFSSRDFYYLLGGKRSLMDAIKEIFISHGGQVIDKGSINKIVPGREIKIDIDGREIESKNLIISTMSGGLNILLGDKKMRRIKNHIKKIQNKYYAFTLHMGIMTKGIPEKMAPYSAIYVSENEDILDNMIYVELSLPEDFGRAPCDKRALSATALLKNSPLFLSNLEFNNITEIIMKYLKTVIPFLEVNLDYLNVEASIEFSKKYHNILNESYNIKSGTLFNNSFSPKRTHMKNIYIMNGRSQSGLGCEGEIMAGRNAAFSIITQEE